MSLDALASRRAVFFGGKGGVGKTTLAAAFSVSVARSRGRTLLVSTDPAHSTSDILQMPLSADPRAVTDGLWAMELDPVAAVDRYIEDVKQRVAETTPPRLLNEVQRQIDVARVTPGAEESALFDRFTRILEAEGRDYDRVVFDTAPLGHTLRLLGLPEQMSAWMHALIGQRRKVNVVGRMWRNVAGAAAGEPDDRDRVLEALEDRRDRFVRTRERLTDAAETAFALVLTPERLPILETEKAVDALRRHGIPLASILVNQVLPHEERGAFLERRRERQQTYLERIEAVFDPDLLVRVPLQETDVVGLAALRRLGISIGLV